MLRKRHRFHGYGSVRAVQRHGQTVRGSALSLKFATGGTKPYRVAVVVSRKVSKSAVVRNRIRRRVYEAVRQFPELPPGTDLVFTVYAEQVASLPAAELQQAVWRLIKKAASVKLSA